MKPREMEEEDEGITTTTTTATTTTTISSSGKRRHDEEHGSLNTTKPTEKSQRCVKPKKNAAPASNDSTQPFPRPMKKNRVGGRTPRSIQPSSFFFESSGLNHHYYMAGFCGSRTA